ncbi:MAG: GNAT family N-acetyltransferase [Bacteroidales bacterium]|nr:GNAT family N-acetyltransferase [Bacteroidales bacterium]
MLKFKIYNSNTKMSTLDKLNAVEFLYKHLEQYGDKKPDIEKSVQYALQETPSFGGFILEGYNDDNNVIGIVVINRTGMGGYIPENILVYIAVDNSERGKGYGKELMNKAIELSEGDVALHVEKDNPARFLYEKVGFTNPYLEMRYKKQLSN